MWAINNVLRPDEWHRDADGSIVGVYDAMIKRGWVRLIIQHGHIYVDPHRCSRRQMTELQYEAADRNCIIVDDKTNRDIFNPRRDSPDDGS